MNITKLNVAQSVMGLDCRYTVTPEHRGGDAISYVARFNGQIIAMRFLADAARYACEVHNYETNKEPA